ncbi:nucleotidyltransferase [Rickettsia amblyommatis]|uniref:Nucleotidyltransferase substrate binding protein n=2 Tax=Rickettsia amblyommatis TaxID=33989 RepID=H8K5I6_RICAG|nr:HI0074 family nucleotidyltransferase substrate-binding subunit [Rickettsia amblyommatis]AFC69780.1 nucleotidyltransferase substrate binding protein [Rickettsia amblyommatis str. GAT-30V]ARD87947.1 nucleotidyltransferase [Rickettsia amblyommatis]KJV62212.1 nucleotidyltransferase substrate binding, HI0074 family protein [Rickettsia amblyommatis str. Ac/Pa]KJV93249.1 nucleotidyltransferase substrate binding, HI0074 family protein [Rickettsia amblyommatis str. Darkwater]
MHLIAGLDISSLLKSRKKFEEFRKHLDTEQNKAGSIQSFEFCYELAWKTMKRFCEKSGKTPYVLKDVFREAAVSGLISDPRIWFKFIEIRNITVHTYNEKNLELVISIFDDFSDALNELINNLEKYSGSD